MMTYLSSFTSHVWHKLFVAMLAVCLLLVLLPLSAHAAGLFDPIDPLPGDGCIRGTPPGEEAPLCCLSGFVYVGGNPVEDALVIVSDIHGEIGRAATQHYQGTEPQPYYYMDLTKLTRPITPTDVITLVASYSGVTGQPVRYTVQPGGQRLNLNLYNQNVLALNAANSGIAEPSKFNEIMATAVYSDAHLLYLWDGGNHRMQVFQLDGSGTWRNFPKWQRTLGSQPDQVLAVQAIAVDAPNNRVYLADGNSSFNHGIKVYTLDGDFTGKVIPSSGAFGNGNGGSLGTDAAGNLYVSMNNGIYKYDANENLVAHIDAAQLGVNKAGRPIAVAPNGDFYLVNDTQNGIFKFNSDLQPQPYSIQLLAGLVITRPTMVTVDDQNTVFVFDHTHFKPYALDATTGQQLARNWPSPIFSAGSTVYLAPHGDSLYLISMFDGQIVRLPRQGVSPGGTSTFPTWGGITSNAESIEMPYDIVAARDNSLFYISPWAGRIGRMVGQQLQSWSIWRPGSAYTGAALTIDPADNLLVSDGGRIQRFPYDFAQGTLVTTTLPWDGSGSKLGPLGGVRGLAADRAGYVYVTDPGKHQVDVLQQLTSANAFTAVTSISINGVLSQPLGIVANDQVKPTQLYVSSDGGYIVQLSFDGTQLTYLGRFGPFAGAAHLALGDGGFLWVAAQSAVYKVNLSNPNDPTKWLVFRNTQDATDPNWNAYGIAVTKTADGKSDLLYVSSPYYNLISSFKPMAESDPVATIVHLSAGDLLPGATLTATAAGQDGHASNTIVQYEWTTSGESAPSVNLSITSPNSQVQIPTVAGATQVDKLGAGLHWLRLRVQDQDGAWSQPVSTTVFVNWRVPEPLSLFIPPNDPTKSPPPLPKTCKLGGLWTMLLYLDADNLKDGPDLLAAYQNSLTALQNLNHPCVQVAVQIDGPGNGDTQRWLIRPVLNAAKPTTTPGWFAIGDAHVAVTEVAMDQPDSLSDFIKWGQGNLAADHYYLAIADHGNADQGIAFDQTSDPLRTPWTKYLKPSDLRTALTAPGVLPVDVVHLDACSMALLDVAYELRGPVKYLIASQYVGWGFFAYADYASYITQHSKPDQLASLIVNRYAKLAQANGLPYTLSAINLARIEPVKNGVDFLAMYLRAWLNADSTDGAHHKQLFNQFRNKSQFFDSNSNYLNTPRDAYIDLKDFVTRLKQAKLTADITISATAILNELDRQDGLILIPQSASANLLGLYENGKPAPIDLTRSSGISLYYPAEGDDLLALPPDPAVAGVVAAATPYSYTQVYADYIANNLFDFTRATRWGEFLQAANGQPPADPTQLASPPTPLAPPIIHQVYLPAVIKK